MPINTETLNRQLYKRLSKYKPKPLDAKGNVTPVEDDADVFKFTFSKDGEDYGNVFATIDDNHALTIYYSDDVTESPPGPGADLDYDDSWTGLLKQLKSWAMHNQLSWNLKDRSRLEGDMARRDHMNKKDKISEGYHAMGKSRSYSDNIPSVKIVIEHSRQIEEGEQRYRNINKIFLENQMGERFLLDTKKPGIARVYARHIAEGGKVNDERWNHIQGLCEEYQKMAGFVRATRNGQFNESAQKLVNEAINHYQGLRESLSRMTGKRGYEAYFESWTPPLMEDETDTSNLNELFVQETLDPRIESVMPILSKLQKNLGEMKEVSALAEWADSLLEGGDGGEASEEPVDDDMGNDTFGGEDGNDAPADDLTEAPGAETLAHNDRTEAGNLKAFDLDEEESLTSNNPIGIPEEEVDESALQAYLGDKKYGKDGMDALRKAGREHAGKEKMQNIRAKFSNKEKDVAEDLDANQKRVGQLGPTEKVKNNNIGKLVGANENFIGMAPQAVAEGDYPDGSSIKTPDAKEWKQQYQQAVMAVKNAKTQQEYEVASDRAGRIKDLLASKGIQVGPVLGQGLAEGLHPMIIADVEKLATLNPSDRYSAYANIRGYFKGDPELSKMAADLMGGYYEADMLRGKYKTAEAKAKYAELEPMNQAFIKRALGQEQTVAEGQEDLDTIKRLLGK